MVTDFLPITMKDVYLSWNKHWRIRLYAEGIKSFPRGLSQNLEGILPSWDKANQEFVIDLFGHTRT